MTSTSNGAAVAARAYVRCDRCGDFVAFNPRDVRGSLGDRGPRCPDCADVDQGLPGLVRRVQNR